MSLSGIQAKFSSQEGLADHPLQLAAGLDPASAGFDSYDRNFLKARIGGHEVKLSLSCLCSDPRFRPAMQQVSPELTTLWPSLPKPLSTIE
uniref:Uncharacterized protein n=1 Tax=Salix viminalis TaxID=40686 RepID=A0A6N2MXX8_SALVM